MKEIIDELSRYANMARETAGQKPSKSDDRFDHGWHMGLNMIADQIEARIAKLELQERFQAGQQVYWTDHNLIQCSGIYRGMDGATTAVVDADLPQVGQRRVQVRFLSAHKSLMDGTR